MRFTSYELEDRVELLWALSIAFAFTVVRWFGNGLVLGHVFIQQQKAKLKLKERLFEEVWLLLMSAGLLAGSWTVFFNNGVGATLTHVLPLVHGWPNNRVGHEVLVFLRVETGWYLHQVTRGWSASGVPIDNLMFYHHIGTLLIIRFCFWKNLLLLGILTVSIFNISNPFLHLSKVAYVMNWRRMRVIFFSMFALAFFVSRIIMLPLTIMKMGYVDAYEEDVEGFGPRLLMLGNVMMLVLYALQVYWMIKIFKVLNRGKTGSTPTKSEKKKTEFSETRPEINGKSKTN